MIPKILLTNDDGIDAPGMMQMISLLAPFSCEIAVFAPKHNHSGAGHAISLGREIEIVQLPPQGTIAIRWQIDGTPVDAVKFALDNLTFVPDLVLSGINNGPNMGNNIHYSGTIGAALEAFFHYIPSIAFSVENCMKPDWETGVIWGRKIVQRVLPLLKARQPSDLPFLLNVNFPDLPSAEVKGVRLTKQGKSGFREKFHPAPSGRPNHYILDGEMVFPDTSYEIDTVAVRDGFVSISPLHSLINCTHALPMLQAAFADL